MGDFNLLRSIGQLISPPSPERNFITVTQVFSDGFISSGLAQWVTVSTFNNSDNTLYFVFTTSEDRVGMLWLK